MAMPGGRAQAGSAWKRVATSAVLIPLFVWAVLGASPWLFRAIVVAAAAAASWELLTMFEHAGRAVYRTLGVVLAAAVTASFLVPGAPVVVLAAATGITLSAPVWTRRMPVGEPVPMTLLAPTYVAWLLGHALFLQRMPEGPALILFLVGVTWAGESAAYVFGSLVGRHKLAPLISPGKTVEGSIAQVVISAAAALPLAMWLLPAWTLGQTVLAGVLLGIVGQVGDLSESAIKRGVGAKDASTLIPGHGGLLDRLDGLLFNTPVFFYYARLLGVGA
jgi:phosphatidate cytidylyltransferase